MRERKCITRVLPVQFPAFRWKNRLSVRYQASSRILDEPTCTVSFYGLVDGVEPASSTGHPTRKRFLRHCSRVDTLLLYPESPQHLYRRLSRVSRPRLTSFVLTYPFASCLAWFHPSKIANLRGNRSRLSREHRISTMVYGDGNAIIHGVVVRRCAGSGRVVVLIAGRRVHDTRILVALLNTRCYVSGKGR